MKQSIAFGLAFVLLFAAGAPAYTLEGDTRPETRPFVATSEETIDPIARQLQRTLIEFSDCNSVAPHRPWCRRTCPSERTKYETEYGDPNDECAVYTIKYTKSLKRQLPWPLCSCMYGRDWVRESRRCTRYR